MTGRRALQAAPRGLFKFGIRNGEVGVRCPRQSEFPIPNSEFVLSSPGWTRTTDSLLVREVPSPLGHRTMNFRFKAEAVGLEPTSGSRRHLFSRQGPHPAGWLPLYSRCSLRERNVSIAERSTTKSCGGWNRTRAARVRVSHPAARPTGHIVSRS